jgi:lipoyl(octanoyl) transferase
MHESDAVFPLQTSVARPTLTLLIDPPQDGLTNMAVDEALLGMAAAGELGPVLRFYQWSPATLSLGYFQRSAQRAEHPPSERCAVVRRASGGGAILHDRELTYSLVLPAGHPLAARAEPLYRAVHQALIDVLAERGLEARFWDDVKQAPGSLNSSSGAPSEIAFACGDLPPSPAPGAQRPAPNEPFLCFQRRSPGDLVMRAKSGLGLDADAWHKILGSAQRRRHGAVLQHGSLLWGRSNYAPELPGVSELAGTDFAEDSFVGIRRQWSEEIARAIGLGLTPTPSVVLEPWLATAREKFHEHAWLYSR